MIKSNASDVAREFFCFMPKCIVNLQEILQRTVSCLCNPHEIYLLLQIIL